MNRILVSGSLAYDRIMNYPGLFKNDFHPEKLHALSVSFLVDKLQESLGGTAGNIAYNLALLEEKPTLISCAGNDFEKYRQQFAQLGIDTESVQIESDVPTAVAHVITDSADNQITAFYAGAVARQYAKDISDAADLAIISPSSPTEMAELPKKYRECGIPFFYDSGQQITALSGEVLREAIPGAVALFGNDYEIDMMLRKLEWTKEQLLERVPVLVTTLGAEGSLVSTPEKEYRVAPVTAEKAVDPTGAGDAYRAGFAKGWLAKLPLDMCAKFAGTVAVYAVEKYGTQNHSFTMDALRARFKAAYGEDCPI
ncbi:MAG: carbohydrate kinase family protein [bacterium]|nr:carbohydrate kinase family protein [bacterium]